MPIDADDVRTSTLWLTNVVEVNRRVKETLEDRAGLSVTQYRILLELYASRACLACGTLADMLFLTPAAMTHAADRLCADGLATRTPLASNRRVTLVDVTERGLEAMYAAGLELETMLRRDAWATLAPDELEQVVLGCLRLTGRLGSLTSLHGDLPVEPCYITCVDIQQRLYSDLLEGCAFTLGEFRCALCLLGEERLRSADLSDILLLNRSSTSRAVNALKLSGLAEGAVSGSDSRATVLALTKPGRAAVRGALARLAALDADLFGTSGRPDVAVLDTLSLSVHASLRAAARRDRAGRRRR